MINRTRLLGAALAGAICGAVAIAGATVTGDAETKYTAEARYLVTKRSPDTRFLSHSLAIVAEQTARQLNSGDFDGTWVAKGSDGTLTFRASANEAAAADSEASDVYRRDIATLFGGDQPATMRRDSLRAATPEPGRTGGLALAGLAGAALGVAGYAVVSTANAQTHLRPATRRQ